MSFLAPLWLGLAALAAVPLLIHLLRRRIGTRVEFPAARYLRRAEEEHSRDLKVRNVLLMLLRVLAILALALAAARPTARLPGGGHAPTAMAIVLDNSLSTSAIVDGAPVLARLQAAARDVVRGARPADRLWLVTADGTVVSGGAATISTAIDRVVALGGAGDVGGAVRRGLAMVRGAGLAAAEVVVLTDGQATTWRAQVDAGAVRVIAFVPAGAPPADRAVVDAAARPPRWTPRGAVTARVRGDGDSVTYRVSIDTRARAPGEARAVPGAAARTLARGTAVASAAGDPIAVNAAPPERGWVAGTVELEPDELRGDDVGHFAAWIGPAPALRVGATAGPFARSAADALVQGGLARAGDDVALVAAEELVRLPALVVAPSDPVRVGAANRALERARIPWRFGAPVRAEATVQSTDSLLARGVSVRLRYPLVPAGAAAGDTLARIGREPWIVAGADWVLVGSPIDPEATTLPVRAAFVPWVAHVLGQRLGGEPGALVAATPLARVVLPAGAEELELADGTLRPVRAESLSAPGAPGVYFVRRGARRVGALVVNVEPEETELRRLAGEEVAARLQAREVHARPDRFAAALYASGARRPRAGAFLALALVALLLESLLAGGAPLARRAQPTAPRAAA